MFQYGLNGIRIAIFSSRLGLLSIFAFIAGVLSLLLKISLTELALVFVCITVVFALEIINTSIEMVCNILTNKYDEKIKEIKDMSAGAVLVSAIGSFVVACIIFVPRLVNIFC